ncbi:MAG: asparaginase [Capnocytophaga sp.]|nr:asparaginase [Capnocytophaga sp.]
MIDRVKILLIYTGGTIGMVKDFETGVLRPFRFETIKERLPELSLLDCDIETISFETPIDSSDMSPQLWGEIAKTIEENYQKFDGFVVLHGSDTMSYSASALSFMLKNLSKPVIFTGSQLPIGDLRTDARENLITSIHLASLKENNKSVIQEVGLYFEYKLYRGNRTTKINSENFEAFVSANYPLLAESGVHLRVHKEHLLKNKKDDKLSVFTEFNTNVAIIKIFPGITPTILEGILSIPHLEGVVIETYGSGNAPTAKWFIEILEKSIKKGLTIVNVTQCIGGSVIPNKYETGTYLEKIGVINGKDLTTEAAITKLMFLLGKNKNVKDLKIRYEENLRGEID